MSFHFFAFLDRMKYIKRWSLMRSVREENIMEHSEQVALFAHALAVIANTKYGERVNVEKTVLYALYHESSEVMTGDLPTPIKYFDTEINAAYKNLEGQACQKLLAMLPGELEPEFEKSLLPDENSREYKLMKCADKLSAYVKCLEELRCGNEEFIKAKHTIEKELAERDEPALQYFLKEFIPSFSLTLDDLNGSLT